MKYSIIESDGKNPFLTVQFEEEGYELLNSFLLAEVRSFGKVIERGLYELIEGQRTELSFSGNVYSLDADADTALITDDISAEEITMKVATDELYELVCDYRTAYRKLKEKRASVSADGGEKYG